MRLWLSAFALPILLAACVATCQRNGSGETDNASPLVDRVQDRGGSVDAPARPPESIPETGDTSRHSDRTENPPDLPAPTDSRSGETTDGLQEVETTTPISCPEYGAGVQTGKLESASLAEASGLAASRKHPGLFWSHNDSGDKARVFAFDKTGKHLAEITLAEAMPFDCEDMAIGPGPQTGIDYLFLGDVGDNWSMRSSVFVYRFEEPSVVPGQEPTNTTVTEFETLELIYPDGSHDCETVMVDPYNGDIILVVKTAGEIAAAVFVAPMPLSPSKPTMVLEAGTIMMELATGGDISPDGTRMIVKNYFEGGLWMRQQAQPLAAALAAPRCPIPVVLEKQGEAIAFSADGSGYFTVSEFAHEPIYFYEKLTD
jgi:hypothetical protein